MTDGAGRWGATTVAVTGGAGFLGSHLAERFAQEGARVVVLDNFSAADPNGVEALRRAGVETRHVDILEPCSLREALDDADVVLHLAALSNPRVCRDQIERGFDVNVVGVKNVIEASPAARRLVFLSSAAVYGNPQRIPMAEDHPTNGTEPYALGKLMGELVCQMYMQAGRAITVVRNFNTFGPRQAPGFLIPTIITQALEKGAVEIWNGDPVRDFLYVEDFVDAIVRLVQTPEAVGQTVNVGSGARTRVGDLARQISELLEVPFTDKRIPVNGSRELVCDNHRLRTLTGWQPRVNIQEGLRRTIEHYRTVLDSVAVAG